MESKQFCSVLFQRYMYPFSCYMNHEHKQSYEIAFLQILKSCTTEKTTRGVIAAMTWLFFSPVFRSGHERDSHTAYM